MPKGKKKETVKDNSQKELLNIVKQGFSEVTDSIDALNNRVIELENPKDTVIPKYPGVHRLVIREAESGYCPPAYKEAAMQILGQEFGFEVKKVEDQEMIEITVPKKYRNKQVMEAYKSHWKSRRILFENELIRKNPNISPEQKEASMRDYDTKNPKPIIPEDKRSRTISSIPDIITLRKWLLLVRNNIKKELSTEKKESEIPVESLQSELDRN